MIGRMSYCRRMITAVFCRTELENELKWTRLTGRGFGLSVSEAGEDER